MPSNWSQRRGVSPETSRLLVARAHAELVAGNTSDPRLFDVRRVVRESWQRAVADAVGTTDYPRLDLHGDELSRYLSEHPLSRVRDMVRRLLLPGGTEEAGVIVAMGDAEGRLLWVEGDPDVRDRVESVGFVAGANWSESSVGTTAPGTALQLGESVQIRGSEHYNIFVQPWSCTAAPVRDPETGRIIGVIDVTGKDEAVTPQAQLLVNATVQAVEGELLVSRLQQRAQAFDLDRVPPRRLHADPDVSRATATLRVLGGSRGYLDVAQDGVTTVTPLGARHTEILLMLATHTEGLRSQRLAELVYPTDADAKTLRPEMVRLRKILEQSAPFVALESRPYRLSPAVDTDARHVLALLDRGAHRVALASYGGDVLPGSEAPGVVEYREHIRSALREALMTEASAEVLLAYADLPDNENDQELLQLCLQILPARSPRRSRLVARIAHLQQHTD